MRNRYDSRRVLAYRERQRLASSQTPEPPPDLILPDRLRDLPRDTPIVLTDGEFEQLRLVARNFLVCRF